MISVQPSLPIDIPIIYFLRILGSRRTEVLQCARHQKCGPGVALLLGYVADAPWFGPCGSVCHLAESDLPPSTVTVVHMPSSSSNNRVAGPGVRFALQSVNWSASGPFS